MPPIINLNGKIGSPEQNKVSIFDRGFLFGDGVYETGKAVKRCPIFLEDHWTRLKRSASKLSIPLNLSDSELTERLFETLVAFGKDDAYFRVIVTRGEIPKVGLDVFDDLTPTIAMIVQDLPSYSLRDKGMSLVTSSIMRNPAGAQDPNIKTSNYMNSLLALRDAKSRGGDDAILCDGQGRVTEGTTFSVFGITASGTLITPCLKVGILESITRRHILEVAQKHLPVEEGFYSLEEFQACPEVFIASSVRELIPVNQWDGKAYPVPGPKTAELQTSFDAHLVSYIESHAKF